LITRKEDNLITLPKASKFYWEIYLSMMNWWKYSRPIINRIDNVTFQSSNVAQYQSEARKWQWRMQSSKQKTMCPF
jgi:hypothetical protein